MPRLIRLLRSRQIAPELLKARLDEGQKVGVVDLLRFEDDPEEMVGIPGAIRLDPHELRHKRKVVMPNGLDMVLYCRSKNSFVSARVAAVMRRHGIDSIYVLAGGLSAWEAMKFPVSLDFATPEEELTRLGIEVYPPGSPQVTAFPLPNGEFMGVFRTGHS